MDNTDREHSDIACPGCGAELPDPGGVTPPGPHTSPGCWSLYGDVVGREYGEWGNPPVHRLTQDTYAVQHSGDPSPQAVQSVGLHLVALHLALERGVEPGRVGRELGRVVSNVSELHQLEPPPAESWLTIVDVAGARDLREHAMKVHRWAQSVWEAWAQHHDTIRAWAGH
ncbi:MAG TPA: DUF5946 family protein [Longimicrobiales bacterium]|nr:DUF5946 family protein [Longimicrobiales bacterium]